MNHFSREHEPDPKTKTASAGASQSLPLAIISGLITSLLVALVWATVTYLTGYQIAFMAIVVGLFVGLTVNFFGKGNTLAFGLVGGAFSLLGCLLGNLLAMALTVYQSPESSVSMLTFLTSPNLIGEAFMATTSPMGLLFYGIAVFAGYKASFRISR